MKAPFNWFGGKGSMVRKLLYFIPKHTIYVEPFGGGAHLLFAKKPSPVEVYNDLDSSLVNFFRVLRDPDKFKLFYEKVSLTPYSREEFKYAVDNWEKVEDDVEKAYLWYISVMMSFNAKQDKFWSFAVDSFRNNMALTCYRWVSSILYLPEIHKRVLQVQIEHDDAKNVIKRYDTKDTFFYCDPPYFPDTRKRWRYRYDMSVDDHKELLNLIISCKGKFLLSGYDNELYNDILKGWNKKSWTVFSGTIKSNDAEKRKRVEVIWYNYELGLFD